MLLSINWLKEFVAFDIPAAAIADRLTMAGLEVDAIIPVGTEWDRVTVGEILQINRHPNADKLSLVKVQAGDRTYSVVCGAPNIREGQKIPLALEGANLPNGVVIKKSKIRGEPSEGMICSETELALGTDTSGILVLPADAPHGNALADYLNLRDTILDVSITPNRSDCLSVIGLAREIAAIFNAPLRLPEHSLIESGDAIEKTVSVTIQAPDHCPRYTARLIRNVKIQPSPLWMQRRLINCGIRAINNIVDVTNYVLLEWGQPLHAFDLRYIQGNKIIVATARPGETFVTLDEIERKLPDNSLMICDEKRAVAIGGIMGGLNSGVLDDTTSVLLESAYFTPSSINRTSRSLNLKTEASLRFEKGIDINGVVPSLNRAAALMAELSGGAVASGYIDAYPSPLPESRPISVSVSRTNRIAGTQLSGPDMTDILHRLQFIVSESGTDELAVAAPSFRYDIAESIDVVEEIARINGYEHIPVTAPAASIACAPLNQALADTGLARSIMVAAGFSEVINYSFISPEMISSLGLTADDPRMNAVVIRNPLSSAQSVLRTTLLPGLLTNLKENISNAATTIKLFELGRVFIADPAGRQPRETRMLAAVLAGLRYGQQCFLPQTPVDFFDIKGAAFNLLSQLHIEPDRMITDAREPYLHPAKMLTLYMGDDRIGAFGEMHPDVLESFDIRDQVYILELDFDLLTSYAKEYLRYQLFSRHPAVFRDIALIVDENVSAGKIYDAMRSFNNKLITDIAVFDIFRGGTLPPGTKSLAFRIKFQAPERTLTDAEVNKIHDRLISFIAKETGAQLRQ